MAQADWVFEHTAQQIAEEERRLRQVVESQLQEYVRLVAEFAGVFLAEELDQRLRSDPYFIGRATPDTWRSLLYAARRPQRSVTGNGHDGEANRWRAEAERLQAEVTRLETENRLLRDLLRPAAAKAAGRTGPPATPGRSETRTGPSAAPGRFDADPVGLADVRLPELPAVAPARFADQFSNWPRQGLALAALGVTGWSMRLAIADLLSELNGVAADAGSIRRMFQTLAQRQFWIEQKVVIAGIRSEATTADTTLILVRLSPTGREVLRACGIAAVPSEWERLAQRGNTTLNHIGLVCTFTYQARRRGWATTVAPTAECHADALVQRQDEAWLVEVIEADEGEPQIGRWQQQVACQGRLAVATVSADLRQQLVARARAAGIEHGLATDLQSLFETQQARGPLWMTEW